MDTGYEASSSNIPIESCQVIITDASECFICRDAELVARDPLRNFCDCKNMVAHHLCLATWIKRGHGSLDRLRCIACKAEVFIWNAFPLILLHIFISSSVLHQLSALTNMKTRLHNTCLQYQLQRNSPWWSLSCQWQTWLVLITAAALLGLVPYVVYCLMTAFTNPPPHTTFKMAAVCFGFLTESLLIKCLSSYLTSRYRQAEQCSFTVQARGFEESKVGLKSHASSAASASQEEDRKPDAVRNGCLSFLFKL